MNPVLGVGPTSKAAATLFTLLHLTHAQFLGPDSGNVGEYTDTYVPFFSLLSFFSILREKILVSILIRPFSTRAFWTLLQSNFKKMIK